MIYILIGIFIIILAYAEAIIKDRKFSHYSLIYICFVMVLLAGLRNKVGTDWNAYFNFYKETTDKVEIGYALLNNSFSKLSIPYNIFLLFINGFSLTLMYMFLRKNSYFMIIGALIFFSDLYLYFNLSGIRQAIALSITCFSITYSLKKQFFKFFLLILFASCFHLSAIIFLTAYFLPRNNLNYRHLVLFCIVFFSLSIFLNPISDLITLYTLKDADYYVNIQEKADNLLSLFYIGIAKRVVIVGIVLVFGRRIFKYPNFQYFFNIYLFGLAIYLSTYMISPDIGARISSYFTIFDIIIAGNLIYVIEKRNIRILIVTIFSFIALYKLVGYMQEEYFIYHSIINIF